MRLFKSRPVDISAFRHLYPFTSRYMDMNGLKYHYLDEGTGDPVVMVHGNPTWSFYFRRLVQDLSTEYRCIVPDHIGCGLSDKPDIHRYDYRLASRIDDLEALLDHIGADRRITLIIHDWGGMIGTAFAVRYPERISRMVILNTSAFFPPGNKPIPLRLRIIRNLPLPATLAVQGLNLFAGSALFMATNRKLPKAVKAGLIAPYNCWNNRIATLKFVQDIPLKSSDPSYRIVRDVSRQLNHLSHIPKLICWGEKDFVFDMDYLAQWEHLFPDARVCRFPEAGHYVLEDEPERVSTAVRQFLERHPL